MAKNIDSKSVGGKTADVVVVMVPLPAQGHLNQLLHLSHIISGYGLPVHFIGTSSRNRQAQVRLHGWDPKITSKIQFHNFLTPPNPPNPKSTTNKVPTQLIHSSLATFRLREPIFELVKNLSSISNRVVVIYDFLMTYPIQDVHSIPNAELYCFQCVSAFTAYTYIWEMAGKPVMIDGEALKDILPCRQGVLFSPELDEFVQIQSRSRKLSAGIIFNTSRVIEGEFVNVMAKEGHHSAEKHWAIGPFNPLDVNKRRRSESEKSHKCLEWIDKQPTNSVILVSFGTTTSLSDKEIEEIAIGLVNSGAKFIWVLMDADRGEVVVGEHRGSNLPEGYEERIIKEGKGLILRDWAPQLEILAHSSTGGFMSHCGWNSCIESISYGVPMAAWPMHSDQPRNAILVTKYLKIGIRVGDWGHEGELVKADEVERVVKKLMDSKEGDQMRKKAAKLRDTIKKSVEKGGDDDDDEAIGTEMDAFIAHLSR
ncbi:OLC1v1036729C1 [Oldenlandia corymbosa var. corymbosa]|uniref:Glycosyltransferase n=1 Tax=Oldenlandia corymbosa var. corymbosa TaxID=529605 RepID=A0AAV1CWM9_OLDCO|nr:OLC1v1036729C1 [Oldenlandia corymbosa var. corymbosa]